ncbi:MAG: glycosyltransferase [Bacteroidales bacterium]|nr:glycosyltransferase [Bacteroidales bacterium]
MRILHLLPTNRFSGAENVACQIIKLFAEDQEYGMAYCSPEGPIRREVEDRDIPFIGLESFSIGEVRRAIEEYQPDLIHAHDMRASLMAVIVGGRVPVISHIHVNSTANNRLSLRALTFLLAAIWSKHVFWVSNSTYEGYFFRNCICKKSTVLYNVINEKEVRQKALSADSTDSFDVAYVGRLSEQKDPVRLMKVIKSVVGRLPNLRVAVVGSGEMEQQTKAECQRLGIEQNVTFMGFMSNPLGILKSSKVMVMTSKREGTPMCVLEAQALGIPVVSTPTDGVKDVITDSENGFLSNDDEELADRIVSIVSSKELFDRLSAVSLEKSHKYNDLAAYKQTLDFVYQQSR